jgi:glycosyltransferase involved in cell wall biosynthesis
VISLIIPVYNKESVLFHTLSSLFHDMKHAGISDFEVIIVNDGSTDTSLSQAQKFKQLNNNVTIIKIYTYIKNIGKGFALRYGYFHSKGDPVIFLDGDMDINTRQVVAALNIYHKQSPDMVLGSKYHPASRIYYPNNRFLYSLILRKIINQLFQLSVSDTQVGLKVFSRHVLEQVFPRLIIKRFAVDLELLVVAQMLGFNKIIEMPVIIRHTSANQSTINIWAVKDFCQDIVAIAYRKYILHYYDSASYKNLLPSMNIKTV